MERVLDINRSFKTMRLLTVLAVAGFMITTCIYFYMYINTVNAQQAKVYVVTDKGTYAALAKEERDVSTYEAKFMSDLFIKMMFAHDADTYAKHMEAALHLCDKKTGTYLAESFEKGNVQQNYVRWGSRTEVEIDSIKIVSSGVPMKAVAYFRQNHWIGAEQKAYLNMACKFELIKTQRHDKNPFGLQVSNFDFFENRQATAKN